ncbi:MAG: site-specific integrase [Planctomycetes bacterium]|nr:site-specific integrase [Planctomycetota bacterium]
MPRNQTPEPLDPEARDRRSASSSHEEGGRRRRRVFGRIYRKPTSQSTWYVRFPDPERRRAPNGRVREIVRSVPSRRAAEALLAEVRKALYAGTYAPPPPALAGPAALTMQSAAPGTAAETPARPFTVLDAIDEYIASREAAGRMRNTLDSYRGHRNAIAQSPLGTVPADAVTPADIEAFRAWRRERSWKTVRRPGEVKDPDVTEVARAASNATVNRALMVLGASLNRLVKLGRLRENPVLRVVKAREARQPRVSLTKDEARRLIEASDPALRPLVAAGLYTGARLGELLRLTWADVTFGSGSGTGTISLFRPKVGNASRIPFHPRLAEELLRVRESRARKRGRPVPDDEPIFLSSYGRAWVTIGGAFKKALRTAGLEGRGIVYHSLRHTFAVHFLEGGAAVTDLQGILGHADLTTTQIYAHMVDSRTRASLVALDYGAPAATGDGADPGPAR